LCLLVFLYIIIIITNWPNQPIRASSTINQQQKNESISTLTMASSRPRGSASWSFIQGHIRRRFIIVFLSFVCLKICCVCVTNLIFESINFFPIN
jgi:hypothetical protein